MPQVALPYHAVFTRNLILPKRYRSNSCCAVLCMLKFCFSPQACSGYQQYMWLVSGSEAIMHHGGIAALVNLLNNGHMEAWASATHTLHMLCDFSPAATLTIMQTGLSSCYQTTCQAAVAVHTTPY